MIVISALLSAIINTVLVLILFSFMVTGMLWLGRNGDKSNLYYNCDKNLFWHIFIRDSLRTTIRPITRLLKYKHSVIIGKIKLTDMDEIFKWLQENVGYHYYRLNSDHLQESLAILDNFGDIDAHLLSEHLSKRNYHQEVQEAIDNLDQVSLRFDFIKESDAVLFKLTWG